MRTWNLFLFIGALYGPWLSCVSCLPTLSQKAQIATVANPHPFTYLINPGDRICTKDIYLLVYVHSAPYNLKRRESVRQTWGRYHMYKTNVRVVFVMGESPPDSVSNDAIQYENDLYGDIIQENFLDTYRNLTYKAVAAMKWVSHYCSHAKWVLKTDDDIFVNMFSLIDVLRKLDAKGVAYNTRALMCDVQIKDKVLTKGKWYVKKSEYGFKRYPTFCRGIAYFATPGVFSELYRLSYSVPFFWIDDVYMTGLVANKSDKIIHKKYTKAYILIEWKFKPSFNGPKWRSYLFAHVHNLNRMFSVWNKLVRLALA